MCLPIYLILYTAGEINVMKEFRLKQDSEDIELFAFKVVLNLNSIIKFFIDKF